MILIGKKQHTKRAEKINVDKLHIGGFVLKKNVRKCSKNQILLIW